jgi:hypothetical protein
MLSAMDPEEGYLISRSVVLLRSFFKFFVEVLSNRMTWDV